MLENGFIKTLYYDKIDISKIDIDENIQARIEKVEKNLDALIDSIKNVGLIEPVVLMEIDKGKKYSICAGQRRLLAFKKLEKDKIPARVIAPVDDRIAKLISLSENLQKKDIDFIDKCRVVEVTELTEHDIHEILDKIPSDIKSPEVRFPSFAPGTHQSLFDIIELNVTRPTLQKRFKTVLEDLEQKDMVLLEILVASCYVLRCRTIMSMDMLIYCIP